MGWRRDLSIFHGRERQICGTATSEGKDKRSVQRGQRTVQSQAVMVTDATVTMPKLTMIWTTTVVRLTKQAGRFGRYSKMRLYFLIYKYVHSQWSSFG